MTTLGDIMKFTTLIAFSITTLISLTPQSAKSEDGTGPYLSLGGAHFQFDSDHQKDDEEGLYLGLGYQFTPNWALEINRTDLDTSAYSDSFSAVHAVYRYNPRNESSFYWRFGSGRYETTSAQGRSAAARIGAGYEANINDNFSFVAGLDMIRSWSSDVVDWSPYAGINYYFGSGSSKPAPVTPKPQPKPQPKDSDGDGVIDSIDQCPNSPQGVKVDSNGCELDSDGDGVKDSQDKCQQTPAGAKVDENGCRIVLTENVSIQLNVQFANNSNEVTDQYREEIGKVATFMRQYPDTSVVIEGHTDSRGAAEYNRSLSQRRANAVMEYLISEFNIDRARVTAEGKGEVSPIADNETAEGRAQNRRVQAEIKVTVQKPQ